MDRERRSLEDRPAASDLWVEDRSLRALEAQDSELELKGSCLKRSPFGEGILKRSMA